MNYSQVERERERGGGMERERGGSMSSDSVFTEAGMRLLSMNITMPAQRLTGVLIPENSLEN